MPRVKHSSSQHDPWHRRAVSLRFGRAFAISVSAMGCFATAAALPHGLTSATSERPVKKANIIVQLDEHGVELPNTRFGPIMEVGPKIGLSPKQIRRIRKTEGDIWCVNEHNQPITRASAQLLLPTVVATAAHFAFNDKDGGRLATLNSNRELRAAACFFRNKAGDPKASVKFDDPHAKFYTRDTTRGAGKDLLLLKLDSPIAGAEPFPVDTEGERPLTGLGEKVFSVTAHMEGRSEHPEQNIVQQCHTFAHGIPDTGALAYDVLDCAAVHECSGGTIFSVENGELRVYAIIARSGYDAKNGHPFSMQDGSATIAIRTNEQILKDAVAFSQAAEGSSVRRELSPNATR